MTSPSSLKSGAPLRKPGAAMLTWNMCGAPSGSASGITVLNHAWHALFRRLGAVTLETSRSAA
jgi:hypothetical protein